MFYPYQLERLIELAWVANPDMTTEDVLALIAEAEKNGHITAASLLREQLSRLAQGQYTKIAVQR